MRGSIKPHLKGSFKIWIELPSVAGKRKREVLIVRGTRKEAEAQMARRIDEIERGQYSQSGNMTVRDCVERWLKARAGSVGAKTYDRYKGMADYYIVPTLGDLPLKKLMPLHVEDALAKWRDEKCKSRKPGKIGKRTVHHIFSTLSAVMAQAVRWNLITKNPCESVTAPAKGHSEVTALDEDQVLRLLQAIEGTPIAAPTQVAVMSGLRRGELLALRWEDVNLESGTIRVARSLEQLKGGECAFKEPKTRKSRRLVHVPPQVLTLLKRHKAEQNMARLAMGPGYNAAGLVFPDPITGRAWGPDKLSAAFYYQAHKAGVNVSFHGLRHSFATIAGRAGVPMKVVSEMLGHSSIAITADLYSHVFVDSKHEASLQIGEAFAKGKREAS